ncbi:MAG: Hsp20/alpha crystallin family protein [Pyrinomonadaceae bacterium]|nr:Hsp20/alpha crystallin family protein [Pyrinomonadaceae bacterium]
MNIMKYDPFRDLRNLQDEMNRLFSSSVPRLSNQEEMSAGWSPSVDIYEGENQIVLEAELPGMKRDDFELSIENSVITLKGERHFEKKDERDNYHRVERAYGSFTRSFNLPRTVSTEDIKAEFQNGVLTVTLPKREEAKARKIEISGQDSEPKTIEATANNAA